MPRKGGESICDCGGGEADNNLFCQDTELYSQNGCSSTQAPHTPLSLLIQIDRDFVVSADGDRGTRQNLFRSIASVSKLPACL